MLDMDLSNAALDREIVGRGTSFFAADIDALKGSLTEMISGSRILVIGGAGSIGFQTLRTVAAFGPKAMHVIDHNENGLAELVRAVRASPVPFPVDDFLTLPFDYGGAPFALWLNARATDYDYVLNFAALKHVRSEKDAYSILAMLETNVLHLENLARMLAEARGLKRMFCVSTDKAANPSSMMGATKRLMEHALFLPMQDRAEPLASTSARFANVAFSNGSLLQSWQMRLAQRQPMACPEGCRRFFVTLPESGHLCTLAAFGLEPGGIAAPALRPEKHLVLLQDVATRFLQSQGIAPVFTRDEAEALSSVEALAAARKWPVLLTPLDTAGEKPYEEFVAEGEEALVTPMPSILRIAYKAPQNPDAFARLLDDLKGLLGRSHQSRPVTIDELKASIGAVEASFLKGHVVSAKSLDQRI
ncbi:UDP-N-acetyl-alpha-D-glucosamine C6 dehydratase [Defluviimonas aquaemixtae]|uniref:UDP-N-acetyl-alpha-D-glucosamine C6 dehydratase n=1 Tax=Albidovulum aquaemixtae TaxID=1542388 RepID=A0A2R8B2V2_9RHOB|nr:polysaccharide biosynthesis protein [Defluviimonas aquaemixtae]SPH16880.1 UDP-N-acetyl-alpha-D-glucosamine C6 dehydratase [Defluviimonas aquaemixtae]